MTQGIESTFDCEEISSFNTCIPVSRLPSPVNRLPSPISRLPSTVYRLSSPVTLLPCPVSRLHFLQLPSLDRTLEFPPNSTLLPTLFRKYEFLGHVRILPLTFFSLHPSRRYTRLFPSSYSPPFPLLLSTSPLFPDPFLSRSLAELVRGENNANLANMLSIQQTPPIATSVVIVVIFANFPLPLFLYFSTTAIIDCYNRLL